MQPRAINAGKLFTSDNSLRPPSLKLRGGHFFACAKKMVGVNGVEPLTPRLSSACSNQLSYTPKNQSKVPSLKSKVSSGLRELVELRRLELLTYSLQSYRSTN